MTNPEHLAIVKKGASSIAEWRANNPHSALGLGLANLGGADLGDANLSGADLGGADLRGANLRGADLGDVRVWQIGPAGSRRDYLVIKQGPGLDEVHAGCFYGTLTEFEEAVRKQHGDNAYGREYMAVITMVRSIAGEAK